MEFIKLNTVGGLELILQPSQITSMISETAPRISTTLDLKNGTSQKVIQSLDEILAKIAKVTALPVNIV